MDSSGKGSRKAFSRFPSRARSSRPSAPGVMTEKWSPGITADSGKTLTAEDGDTTLSLSPAYDTTGIGHRSRDTYWAWTMPVITLRWVSCTEA